jgi:hypothetical protein
LRIFILLDEAGGEFYPAGVPMPVWRTFLALVAVLARVGKLLGYEAHSPVRRPTRVWGRVAVVVAAGLAGDEAVRAAPATERQPPEYLPVKGARLRFRIS